MIAERAIQALHHGGFLLLHDTSGDGVGARPEGAASDVGNLGRVEATDGELHAFCEVRAADAQAQAAAIDARANHSGVSRSSHSADPEAATRPGSVAGVIGTSSVMALNPASCSPSRDQTTRCRSWSTGQ